MKGARALRERYSEAHRLLAIARRISNLRFGEGRMAWN
jgi:hypothetical protein